MRRLTAADGWGCVMRRQTAAPQWTQDGPLCVESGSRVGGYRARVLDLVCGPAGGSAGSWHSWLQGPKCLGAGIISISLGGGSKRILL